VEEIKKLDEGVRDKIDKNNTTYSAQANKHQKRKGYSTLVI